MAKKLDLEDGKILLFDNQDDKSNSKGPDFTGQVNVGGEFFRVALWYTRDGDLGGQIQDIDDNGSGGRGGQSRGGSSRRDRDDDDRGRSRGRDDEDDDRGRGRDEDDRGESRRSSGGGENR